MLKRYIHSTIIFAILAIPSVIIISYLFAGPAPDDLINIFIAEQIISDEWLEMFDVYINPNDFYSFLALLQINLLLLTYVYIIILDVLDAIKIAPHWFIKSLIFAGLIILIDQFFLKSTIFAVTQMFSTAGVFQLTIYTTIYYLTMFHLILIVKNWLS